jgi:hypothetical protein
MRAEEGVVAAVVMQMTPIGEWMMWGEALKEGASKKSLTTSPMTTGQLQVDRVCLRTW